MRVMAKYAYITYLSMRVRAEYASNHAFAVETRYLCSKTHHPTLLMAKNFKNKSWADAGDADSRDVACS